MITRTLLKLKVEKLSLRAYFGTNNAEVLKYKYDDLSDLVSKVTSQKQDNTTTVTLVRHGQSYGNLEDMVYGSLDYNLTPLGLKQALNVKNFISPIKEKFTSLNSSDLIRAYLTGGISLGILDKAIPDIYHLGKLSGIDKIHKVYGEKHEEFDKLKETITVNKAFREMDFGPLEGARVVNMTDEEHMFLFRL